MELTEWARLQEELLKVQLSVIRQHIRKGDADGKERASSSKRKSQMDMIIDILSSAGSPLHVLEIIRLVEQKFGIKLDRESMVSALTKKVNKGVAFVRTGPNTFSLKGQ